MMDRMHGSRRVSSCGRAFLTAISLTLTSLAVSGETTLGLEKAQIKAQEIVERARQTRDSTFSDIGLAAGGPARSDLGGTPRILNGDQRPKSWRGISAARLRTILGKCPLQVQQDAVKSLTYINAAWVGGTENAEGIKRCLGAEEYGRFAQLLTSSTNLDQACSMNGQCVATLSYMCNETDCTYYGQHPAAATKNTACWTDGRCYRLNNYLCNRFNCDDYSNSSRGQ